MIFLRLSSRKRIVEEKELNWKFNFFFSFWTWWRKKKKEKKKKEKSAELFDCLKNSFIWDLKTQESFESHKKLIIFKEQKMFCFVWSFLMLKCCKLHSATFELVIKSD